MMNKNKTARVQLVRFLILVPVVAVLLLAFRKEQTSIPNDNLMVITDTIPVKPENIESIDVTKNGNENFITIRLKTGEVEKYNISNEKERKAFEAKYGPIPEPPPPPAPPTPSAQPIPPAPPAPVRADEAMYKAFLEKNPSVKKLHWEMDPARVVVTLKNGTSESFELQDEKAIKAAFTRYPDLSVVFPGPPPPPPPPNAPNAPRAEAQIHLKRSYIDTSGRIDASLNGPGNPNLSIRGTGRIDTKNQPLYVVNGTEWPEGTDLNNELKPELIQSITVLKDASAEKLYGEKGKNGVIIISTSEKVKIPEPSGKE